MAGVVVAERGPQEDDAGVDDEEMAQVHGGVVDAGGADAVEQGGGLLLANAAEGEHAALAEKVEHADASRLAPVLAVGSEGHVTPTEKALDHRPAVSPREGH